MMMNTTHSLALEALVGHCPPAVQLELRLVGVARRDALAQAQHPLPMDCSSCVRGMAKYSQVGVCRWGCASVGLLCYMHATST